jgi:hypothetical protein
MFQPLGRSLLPRAIALGATTEARMQSVLREIERALTDGRQYSVLWQLMVGVWKRKPALQINEPSARAVRQPGHAGAWTCGAGPRAASFFPGPSRLWLRFGMSSLLRWRVRIGSTITASLSSHWPAKRHGHAPKCDSLSPTLDRFQVRANHTDRTPHSVIPCEGVGSSNLRRCEALDPRFGGG